MPGATSRGLSSRRWAIAYLFMYAAYVLIGMTLRLMDWLHGDALVFVQSSRRVVDGSFDLYGILRTPWIAPPLGTTYGYTPFLAIVIAPVVAVSDMLHLGNVWAMKLIGIPLLLLDVVAMQQLRRFAREWRPLVRERYLFIAIALSLFCTSFLLVTAHKSHPEGLVMLFALLSLRLLPRNLLLSGACAGLALSTKHMTALLLLVPVGVALMMEGRAKRTVGQGVQSRTRRLRETLDWALLAIGIFAAFMLPAVLRDPTAVQYALVTQAQRIVPLGPGLPRWANTLLETNLNPQTYSEIRPTLLAVSNVPLVAAVVIASLAVAWLLRRRGRPLGIADMRLLGLVAFGGISYLLFAKWVSDGYFQMPLALVALWDIVRTTPREAAAHDKGARPFPWVGIGSLALYSTVAHLAPHYARLVGEAPAALATDLFNFALFTTLAVMIIRWAIRVEPEEAQV